MGEYEYVVPSLVTVGEAASLLRVTRALIYAMVRSNEIAHVRVGQRIRIPTDMLMDEYRVNAENIIAQVTANEVWRLKSNKEMRDAARKVGR